MPQVIKSVLVPYSAAGMFGLVDAVEQYPQFLPWCGATTVQQRTAEVTVATLEIRYAQVKQSFTTRNAKIADQSMLITLVEGPFQRLSGAWTFLPLGDDGCKVTFQLDYRFSNGVVDAVIGPVFEMIATTLVDRFVARADAVLGERR